VHRSQVRLLSLQQRDEKLNGMVLQFTRLIMLARRNAKDINVVVSFGAIGQYLGIPAGACLCLTLANFHMKICEQAQSTIALAHVLAASTLACLLAAAIS